MSRFSIEDTAKPDSLLGKTQQFAEGIFDFAKRGAETFGAVKELFEAEEKVQEDREVVVTGIVTTTPEDAKTVNPIAALGDEKNFPTLIIVGGLGLLGLAIILRR